MATLKQIIYNIKNLQGRGEFTDDVKLSDRQLEFIINYYRAELAAQRANKNKSAEGFYQVLNDLKMEVSRNLKPSNSRVNMFVSKTTIPDFVTAHEAGDVIKYVGLRDEFMGFQKSEVNTYNIDIEHPYIRNTFFTLDGKLYVASREHTLLREVFVKAVFSDPRKVLEANNVDINPLDYFNWEYPMPENLIGSLNNFFVNGEFRWMHSILPDRINDAKDGE